MSQYIEEVFGPKGLLADKFDNYSPREGQIEMAHAVDSAFAGGRNLMVEAPTGTGKSLAYSVPAICRAQADRTHAVIVTANIALQEQLVEKDLPLLQELLPWKFSFALLKGRSNYLCSRRYHGLLEDEASKLRVASTDPKKEQIFRWACETEAGDVSELDFEPEPRLWRQFSCPSDKCQRQKCSHIEHCYYRKAKEEAWRSTIIVANYSLLLAHLKVVRMSGGKNSVLPPFGYIVLDEAQKAAQQTRDFLEERISMGSVEWAARQLKKIGEQELHDDLIKEGKAFFQALEDYRESHAWKCSGCLWINRHFCSTALKKPGGRCGSYLRSKHYRHLLKPNMPPLPWKPLVDRLVEVEGVYQNEIERFKGAPEDLDDLCLRKARCKSMSERLEDYLTKTHENLVVFIDGKQTDEFPSVCSRPIDVDELWRDEVFNRTKSSVLTSATLAIGTSFESVQQELGVPEPDTLQVKSPFDYSERAAFFVPRGMPDPNDRKSPDEVAKKIGEIIDEVDGRTLVLFTSWTKLNHTYECIKDKPYRILKQGDMPRTALIKEFREDVSSVLLGTESFWAGIDVPGESLSCVIMDKMPFPAIDDPVSCAMEEKGRATFDQYFLPRAVFAFKQGAGRLIRHKDDYGLIVMLDPRIATRSYASTFLGSLPKMHREYSDVSFVKNFLEKTKAKLGRPRDLTRALPGKTKSENKAG